MWLSDTAVKGPRPVAAIVLSLLLCVFGVISFDKIEPSADLKENK
jgi:multidrug efflux pump subunit AcrB